MAVQPIPEGYHSLTPYLIVHDANAAIDFYRQAFAALELFRMAGAPGKVGHAEIKIGDSILMLADEMPEMGIRSPRTLGGAGVGQLLYVVDCDAVFNRAVTLGAKIERPLQDQFYGDRSGTVLDPFGHKWTIATHTEDLAPEEIARRGAEWAKKASAT